MRRVLFVLGLAAVLTASVLAGGSAPPRWTAAIDSRTTDQWLSEADGAVYGPRGGKLVALDLRDGHERWRSAVEPTSKSAARNGAVVAPTKTGIIFLRSRDGGIVRSVRVGDAPIVAAAPSGFVSVTRTETGVEARGWTFDGRPRSRRPSRSSHRSRADRRCPAR